MRYSVIFIVAALLCLLVGESFGIWMSQDQQRFVLAPAHAHLNLAGWVTLCLYGLVHAAFPALAATRLAIFQCIAAILGAVLIAPGILMAITMQQEVLAILASLLVLAGTLLFAIMFVGKVAMTKATAA
ncbi:MAG: hypothetical protein ABUL73_04140 [Alphaproteobacteria bacterium]